MEICLGGISIQSARMTENFHGWAATKPGNALAEFEFDPGALRPEQVQVKVESCGICHSDLSMLDNAWGNASYPLVPGHEVVGVIEKTGDQVKGLAVGDRVGLGWFAGSCMSCQPCLSGHHNLCAKGEQMIVGRHGGNDAGFLHPPFDRTGDRDIRDERRECRAGSAPLRQGELPHRAEKSLDRHPQNHTSSARTS